MGHPFKEEIVFIEQLANKQTRIGNTIGYRFPDEATADAARAALNALIKVHKNRFYKAGKTENTKYVSLFIPVEFDEGLCFGTQLEVQYTNDPRGGYITIVMTRTSHKWD